MVLRVAGRPSPARAADPRAAALRPSGTAAATAPSRAPRPSALVPSRTAISAGNAIVRIWRRATSPENSGSSSATLVTASTAIASTPPAAPTITPSITNGQRMNQSVAPTSFITSTSRRRAYSDSRIVLAISRIDAIVSRTANARPPQVIAEVSSSIFFVSPFLFETLAIDGSIGPPFGVSADVDRQHVGRVVRDHVECVGQRVGSEQRVRGRVLTRLLRVRLAPWTRTGRS